MIEGLVADFDVARGDGWVRAGAEDFYVHCVNVADGSRQLLVGSPVRGVRAVGRLGRDELVAVEKL